MSNILLGVTGSVASIYTPQLFRALQDAGFHVKVVATNAARYFFDENDLKNLESDDKPGRDPNILILDEDEWPGKDGGRKYQRNDPVLHIELRRWADLFLIAPLDANTLAKLAYGLCDNCLTCVWRAWDRSRPVVLAPAMNTMMWENPITLRHFRQLAADSVSTPVPANLGLQDLLHWINAECDAMRIVPPQMKRLACEDVGMGAMAERADILQIVDEVRQTSPLRT